MRTVEQICALYDQRSRHGQVLHGLMREFRDAYGGNMVLPLPELDRNEKSSVANLIQQGCDGTAQRITSTMPNIVCPPEKNTQKAKDAARDRRLALFGWWDHSHLDLMLGRRARHLIGYGTTPVLIRPDAKNRVPRWDLKDPLGCYPADVANFDLVPDDAIFLYSRTVGWLRSRFPERLGHLAKQPATAQVAVLEYCDDEQITLIATGKSDDMWQSDYTPTEYSAFNMGGVQGRWGTILETTPNLARTPVAVVPGRLTLGQPTGQFDGMLGLIFNKARLSALEMIAIEEGIFPKTWLVARPNETPEIIVNADGRQGIVGLVKGGLIDTQNINPGYRTDGAINRLEREARLEGGVPAEFGGESGSNIRTGRRGDQVLGEAVDYRIQECQRLFERSLEAENNIAIAVAKAYYGPQSKSFYVDWHGTTGTVDYTPDKLFTTDTNLVRYSLAGADFNGQVVRAGQLIGTGLLSKETGRSLIPEIADPEMESGKVTAEALDQALLSGIQQQAASGQIPPADLARIIMLVSVNNKSLPQAVEQVQRESQERQAAVADAPLGSPEAPVDPMSPEAQPGLAAPGAGAEAGTLPSPIPGQGEGGASLNTLLGQLGRTRTQARAS